jgi:predicted RND superfamily exporter protein
MIQLLDEAINKVKTLPESEQERIALLIIQEVNQEKLQEEDEFEQIIENCQIKTGIKDLSYQHNHYLYGTPKQELA